MQFCAIISATDSLTSIDYILNWIGELLLSVWSVWLGPNKAPVIRGGLQTESKIAPTKKWGVIDDIREVVINTYTLFFLSLSWANRWKRGTDKSEVLDFFKVLSAFCMLCCQHVFCMMNVSCTNMQVWTNASKRYCKQRGRHSCLSLLDIMMWRLEAAQAMPTCFNYALRILFCSTYKTLLSVIGQQSANFYIS